MWELEDGTSMGLRRMYECAHFFTAWKSAPPTEDGRGKVDRCEWKVRAERGWRNMYTRSERNCVNSAGTTTNKTEQIYLPRTGVSISLPLSKSFRRLSHNMHTCQSVTEAFDCSAK